MLLVGGILLLWVCWKMWRELRAGHAAEGYAHATGRVGVCIATSGPGATNLVTPIGDAYMVAAYTTILADDEIIEGVEVPKLSAPATTPADATVTGSLPGPSVTVT